MSVMTVESNLAGRNSSSTSLDQVYKKVTRRLIPFIFLCYMVSYLDRINVGFAKLQMLDDLEFSNTVYGLGAGIFFIGYVIFEIPSNLLMTKIGARRTILRIMVLWGVTSAATAFVTTPLQFYIVRFLLGMFEAGFVPAILLYLTYWYSGSRRGAASASFLAAAAFAGAIGGPVSGAILDHFDGALGMGGWQWMFVIEAIPAVILGLLVPVVLSDRPKDATWLSPEERQLLQDDVDSSVTHQEHKFTSALRNPRLYLLGFVYFALLAGVYLISFWLPTIIGNLGDFSDTQIGVITGIPYVAAAIATVWLGRHSDRKNERRWHIAASVSIGMLALLATVWVDNPVLSIVLFTIATAGIFASFPIIWPLPGLFFSGTAIAGALALINSMGTFSGFVIPYLAGWITDLTGSLDYVIYTVGAIVLLGVVALLAGVPASERKSVERV
ncbi:MFS transporter [Blastococcus atacamensis]|uniref:MFS transporter n=1 Tax=Blastococcus atacamensis TaxID=2070508 RepID=UPI0018E45B68|nr:MFS transporter [Blastococcus atacamensis]